MKTEKIQVEVAGIELDFVVDFKCIKGEPAITHLLPENCCEGSADEYEILALYCVGYEQGKCKQYDVSYMLEFIKSQIVEILESKCT